MQKLNIVLHEPEIPQNTGNISRTCAVTGAALHIIRPMGFTVTDAHLKRAGLDYWNKLELYYYDHIDELFDRYPSGKFFFFTTKAKKCYTEADYSGEVFLVFGKETKGLPEELLKANSESCVRIPMLETLRSLNLSNTVAIAAYEALRQNGYKGLETKSEYFKREI
ncbi:MAG: tRNA (uridine(34)/cytosine(34)/5-carboxymethylaminomethyluridine(34)-2'-O)-methyltransferase TrmL [Eubacteriales bacterium]|nr:tRNA (uridine(34)/cytosine(34)/5-carboxymethylaminomethyluridine(34)-2'-O)-methyltransferase TrmL [Eubacteriales bacterium]MDD4475104.1 tRNA (uridine(34)/cytosine(34)/5-carboxymethylaminomethyluridine(34)-2'-O)-methyltransferase TrmL [Eubacteriales bacterium]